MITFLASLASTGNTFSVDGQGFSKVVFSVPESELHNAVKVLLLKDKTFEVALTVKSGQSDSEEIHV